MPAQRKYLFWLYLKILSSFLSFTWSHHCAATRRRADLLGKSEPLCFEEKVFYISVIHSGFSDSSKFLFGIIRTSFRIRRVFEFQRKWTSPTSTYRGLSSFWLCAPSARILVFSLSVPHSKMPVRSMQKRWTTFALKTLSSPSRKV